MRSKADAGTLGGKPVSSFLTTGTDGKVQRFDGTALDRAGVDGSGVGGQIAKWSTATTLSISVIAESGPMPGGAVMDMADVSYRRLVLFLVFALAASCGGSPTSPTVNVPYSQTDFRVGTGADATSGKRITVHYTGWLYSASAADNKGTQFDSSSGRGPFAFTLGAGQVIRGWDQGVAGMKVGGQRRLVLPPELAYGAAGAGGAIPPNATLIFDIELLDVQ